jgi:hypothetical protein
MWAGVGVLMSGTRMSDGGGGVDRSALFQHVMYITFVNSLNV